MITLRITYLQFYLTAIIESQWSEAYYNDYYRNGYKIQMQVFKENISALKSIIMFMM
jgi:hypothetical protein